MAARVFDCARARPTRDSSLTTAAMLAQLLEHMSSGPVVAIELVGPGAIKQWRQLLGPTDPAQAQAEAPGSIRCAGPRARVCMCALTQAQLAAPLLGGIYGGARAGWCVLGGVHPPTYKR